jgi:hypothetical protein
MLGLGLRFHRKAEHWIEIRDIPLFVPAAVSHPTRTVPSTLPLKFFWAQDTITLSCFIQN